MKMKMPALLIVEEEVYEAEDDLLETFSDIESDNDFSEYMWMENAEEFDKLEMQRLEEEEMMKECLEAMFEDELEEKIKQLEEEEEKQKFEELRSALSSLHVTVANIENSRLNPLAAEFVPSEDVSLVPPTTS